MLLGRCVTVMRDAWVSPRRCAQVKSRCRRRAVRRRRGHLQVAVDVPGRRRAALRARAVRRRGRDGEVRGRLSCRLQRGREDGRGGAGAAASAAAEGARLVDVLFFRSERSLSSSSNNRRFFSSNNRRRLLRPGAGSVRLLLRRPASLEVGRGARRRAGDGEAGAAVGEPARLRGARPRRVQQQQQHCGRRRRRRKRERSSRNRDARRPGARRRGISAHGVSHRLFDGLRVLRRGPVRRGL